MFVVAVLLYANTLSHGWVLDDEVVLSQNTYVQQGIGGIAKIFSADSFAGYLKNKGITDQIITGGRYRPLSLAFFAVGVQVWGNQPLFFHLFNVLLFGCCTVLFYKTLKTLSSRLPGSTWLSMGAALLFAVHPVHTEVVANIKSADELLSFLCGIMALWLGLSDSFSVKKQAGVAILLLLSCLSKEIGVIWLLLLPMARWISHPENIKGILLKTALPALGVILFLGLRTGITGADTRGSMMHEPLNNPLVHPARGQWVAPAQAVTDSVPDTRRKWEGSVASPASGSEKTATVVYIFGRYLALMAQPYPLTHDYYPQHITIKNWGDMWVWLSLLVLLAFLAGAVWWWQKNKLAGLGAVWFLLALLPVLNLFFPVGVFMAERFLMLPSAGFCLAVAAVYSSRFHVPPVWHRVVFTGILASWGFMTVVRNTVWESNERLFLNDLTYAPESAKLQFNYANTMMIKALGEKDSLVRVQQIAQTIPHFEKAVALHPFYFDAWQGVGASHFFTGNYPKALDAYAVAAAIKPKDVLTEQNLSAAIQMYQTEKNKSKPLPVSK